MDFLKAILGDDLYRQIESKINEHNGNEANKDKQIKLGNLGGGDYVAKGKYDTEIEKLTAQLTSKSTELDSANGLIADLKKNTRGNEELQGKISGYEAQVAELQKQLQEAKTNAAVKVALLSEKCADIGYLTYIINQKLAEDGKQLELDENENIKGWDDMISGLKTQYPAQFESAQGNGKAFVIEENRLPKSENRDGVTKADLLRMPYAERNKFYQENPEAYQNAMKG
jgi:hypothetical protein